MNVYVKWGIVFILGALVGWFGASYLTRPAHANFNPTHHWHWSDQNQDNECDDGFHAWDNDCVPAAPQVIHLNVAKVICPTEDLLPDWGAGTSTITATTASDFVAANPTCSINTDWVFQYASSSVANPGDSFTGNADGWVNFTGTTNIQLPLGSDYLWVREVPQDGYIGFTGAVTTEGDVGSAELYCNVDTLNYDNYDRVDPTPAFADGNNYYCVAFNAPVVAPPPVDVCPNIEGDQATVPDGMVVNNDGNCVTPDTTPPPSDTNSGGGSSDNGSGGGAFFQSGCPVYADGQTPPWGVVPCATTTPPVTPPASCSPLLTAYLRMGRHNDPAQVMLLQAFLNSNLGVTMPVNGIFDGVTDAFVRQFQDKYASEILAPWHLTHNTGIVWLTTRKLINKLNCATVDEVLPPLTPWID